MDHVLADLERVVAADRAGRRLERVRRALILVRDSQSTSTSNVVRVAAHAGIITTDKYLKLLNESEVYQIAIGALYEPI